MNKLKTLFSLLAIALLAAAPAAMAQDVGYDTPTILPFILAPDGRLVYAETADGKVRKVPGNYKAWPYSGNPRTSQVLDPDGHERVIHLVRKATYNEKTVEIKWVTAPGFAGGFMVFISDRPFRNALQVAMMHIKDGEEKTIDNLRIAMANTGFLTN